MSALPPKADMCSAIGDVCFGPQADILQRTHHVRFQGVLFGSGIGDVIKVRLNDQTGSICGKCHQCYISVRFLASFPIGKHECAIGFAITLKQNAAHSRCQDRLMISVSPMQPSLLVLRRKF